MSLMFDIFRPSDHLIEMFKAKLSFCTLEIPIRILLQTVKTEVKCRMTHRGLHFLLTHLSIASFCGR